MAIMAIEASICAYKKTSTLRFENRHQLLDKYFILFYYRTIKKQPDLPANRFI